MMPPPRFSIPCSGFALSINRHHRTAQGFTLLELMVAIAIIGVLAAIASNQYFSYIRNSRVTQAQQYLQELSIFQEKNFLDTKEYTTQLPVSLRSVPPEVRRDYNNPIVCVRNGIPAQYSIFLNYNPASTMVARHNPAIAPHSLRLAINSAYQKWYERDGCDAITLCNRSSTELSWEEGRGGGGGAVTDAAQKWTLATPSTITTAHPTTCRAY